MNYIIDTNLKNLYVCSDHFLTDGDQQTVRNNVAFDKADTPPLIDVETATEDTSNNLDEEVALIEDTFVKLHKSLGADKKYISFCVATMTTNVKKDVEQPYKYLTLTYIAVDLDAVIRLLRLLTPLSAYMAFVTVAIGLVTGHCSTAERKCPTRKINRTGDPELEYLSKFTVSGLWTLCYTNHAVLRSAPFFFMATTLLVVGEISCFLGHFAPRRRYCTFLSGVTFILSGLLLLLGLVVYVSVFTAEIGSKSYSFHLVVIGFLAGEVAGTSAIFPVHLLALKSNCQKGNAPENDLSSSVDASRFGLHGSPTFWQIGPL
ncbi:hypothetical protein DAPPUDRAFT_248685 [Daphnia pulex]|uniref:Uncharacterized protein n=1 Tax=Daphnia pulex TaxID=6669 RepID=E9GV08_DAPPU|nr:hypothetical protein DAPPUDRAFT_248685 [Daphnia pulex]|eukprot:EFX76583.1 hypothetical protein DAPPUDRAFT_248685 [Daphnia pulex]